jgi:hypothetical protein
MVGIVMWRRAFVKEKMGKTPTVRNIKDGKLLRREIAVLR